MGFNGTDQPATAFLWAETLTPDPTTTIDNRTALTVNEQQIGFNPAGIRPTRQKLNQAFYDVGKWTQFIKSEAEPRDTNLAMFHSYNKGGFFLMPNALTFSGVNMTISGNSDIGAVLDKVSGAQNLGTSTGYVHRASNITKRQDLAWSAGNTGGLKAYVGTVTNTFVHLFIFANVSSSGAIANVDFATDNNAAGINIDGLSNATHKKRIAVLPYIDDGSEKWQNMHIVEDDWIMFDEADTGIEFFNTSSTSYVQQVLSRAVGTGDLFPDNVTKIKAGMTESSGSNEINVKDNPIDANVINLISPARVYTELRVNDSFIRYKSLGGAVTLEFKGLGYKNPAAYA